MDNGLLAVVITIVTAGIFLALGVWYVGRQRITVEDYIVSRNTAGTGLATATLVAGALGAWILFSPAETGTWAGITGLIGYGIGSALPLVAFVLLGARMRRLMPHGHSITEYTWHRFGPMMYYLTLAVVIFYMLVYLTAELTGIAQAVNLIGGTPLVVTALIVGVLTVAYTAYGGMRASLFTDRIQFYVIIPLLVVVILAGIFGFGGGTLGETLESSPELLSLTHMPGIEFGVVLIIAIFAATMFNQGSWQRIYTVRDIPTLRRGYLIAGIVVLPVIFLTGLFGIMAVSKGLAEDPSVAMFSFVVSVMPMWAVLAVLVLAMVLVMSSMDTLLNGITSAITTDLTRYAPGGPGNRSEIGALILRSSRIMTILLIVPAIVVASQGFSVLYLFLIADLVCAAVVFPMLFGLYARNFSGTAAFVSGIIGLVVGALFFPGPDFAGWSGIPGAGSFLYSFGAALGVSAIISVIFSLVSNSENAYDFNRLSEEVQLIEG